MSSVQYENVLSRSIVEQNSKEASYVRSSKLKEEKASQTSGIKSRNSRVLSRLSKRSNSRGIRSVSSIINNKEQQEEAPNSKIKEDQYVRISQYQVEQLSSVNRNLQRPRKNSTRKLSISQKSRLSRSRSNTNMNEYGQLSSNKPSKIQPQGSKLTSEMSIPREKTSIIIPSSKLQKSREAQQLLSYLEDHNSRDVINGPDSQPQKNSFHLNSSKSVDSYQLAGKMSFKEALKVNFQGIDARRQQTKLFEKNEYFRNIVKSPQAYYRTEKRSNYQPTASKRSIQQQSKPLSKLRIKSNYNQSQVRNDNEYLKDRDIQEMHQRLRQLQKQKMAMQTQLAIRQNEIRSLKGSIVHGSEPSIKFGYTPYASNSNFYQHRDKEGSSMKSSMLARRGQSEFQRQVQVHYRSFLEKIKGGNFKKNLIRNKCLALNSEQLEVGCLSRPLLDRDGSLNLTLFITFNHFEVNECFIQIVHDNFIEASVVPQILTNIQPHKQKKVEARLKFRNVPFNIPEITVTYKTKQDYCSKCVKSTLPTAFNKFVQILPFHNTFQNDLEPAHLKTNDFKYNFKNMPLDRLPEYMTGWSVLSSNLRNNQLVLGARCCFINTLFNITIHINEVATWIQGWLLEGQAKIVEFFVCTLKDIFDVHNKRV